jgi:hypothetical protein
VSFLTVELRSASGDVLGRVFDEGAIGRVRPALDDPSSACLRFVDPYGDTVFNPFQAAVLSQELTVALNVHDNAKDREHLAGVINIADMCAAGVHVHLWFIGD